MCIQFQFSYINLANKGTLELDDKRDDFNFDIVSFPFLDGDVPRSTSYGVYVS